MSQTCPRRVGELGPWSHGDDGQDSWRADKDGVRTCSFCGSLHPEDFMQAAREKVELGPTDKDYKVYVGLPEPSPEELVIKGGSNAKECPGNDWVPVADVPEEVLQRSKWQVSKHDTYLLVAPRGPGKFGKFYFQHLSVDQRHEFIELLNSKAIKIGVPGHFYRLPFFCTRKEA